MRTPILETDRLVLRPFIEADVTDVFECWESDPDVAKYMFWTSHNDIEKTREWIAFELGQIEKQDWYRFAIVLKDTNTLIGTAMALGLKYGQSEIEDLESRWKTNDITSEFLELFREENGSYLCKELLGCDLGTPEGIEYAKTHNLFTEFCPAMVVSATKIAEQLMDR